MPDDQDTLPRTSCFKSLIDDLAAVVGSKRPEDPDTVLAEAIAWVKDRLPRKLINNEVCATCRHFTTPGEQYPCRDCGTSKWEPKP